MNENKSVKYIHPEVFHAARSKAFELLDECGLSREKITSSTPDNIEHEQGSSYTFNITYVHDEGCSTYQIKTAGDCFTECTWVDGKKIPAIPENLLNKNINYKKKLIRIWGGQYADIQGLMHYAETGAFTRGEPCPKADHIIQRSIDVSRQIKRLCIIAIDYAITHHEMSEWLSYQREIHSAIPANEEFEREPN